MIMVVAMLVVVMTKDDQASYLPRARLLDRDLSLNWDRNEDICHDSAVMVIS